MSSPWPTEPLGVIAPKCDAPMPEASASVWNLSLEDIESHTGRVQEIRHTTVSDLGSVKCSFDSRHVLYSKLRPYLNKVVLPTASGVGTSELLPLLPDTAQLNREFLAWYLRSPEFLAFTAASTRGANLPRIAMKALWKHNVPVPPLDEQRRIVGRIREAMERVDKLRRLREETNARTNALPSALRHDWWNDLADRYDTASLCEAISSSKNGLYKPRNFHGRGTLLLRMYNLQAGVLDLSTVKRLETSPSEEKKYQVCPGDILMSRVNSRELVGKSALVTELPEQAVFEAMIIRLRPDNGTEPFFLAQILNSPQFLHSLRMRAKHAIGQSSVNQKDVLGTGLPLPPLSVQRNLVPKWRTLLEASSQLQRDLPSPTMVSNLPAAILRKAFAGEL